MGHEHVAGDAAPQPFEEPGTAADAGAPAPVALPDPADPPGATAAAVSAVADDEHHPHLALLITPIIALVIANNIGNLLFAQLATENPLLLIALSPPNRNLILASHQVPVLAYGIVGFLRLLAPDPFFYLLGEHYGDRALGWMERRTPNLGRSMRQLEGAFARFGHVLVLIMPNNPVCLIAGAAHMRRSVFWTLNVVGTIGRLIVMYWIGAAFQDTVDAILDFISRYRVQLLVISFVLVGFNLWREWRAGNSEIQQLLDLETQLEGEPIDPEPNAAE